MVLSSRATHAVENEDLFQGKEGPSTRNLVEPFSRTFLIDSGEERIGCIVQKD
jgi:hypothetical protein